MGCYVKNTNRLFPGLTGELRIEKASGSIAMVSSNIVKELEITKYRITFCHSSLCFIQLKDFSNFIFWSNFE